MKTDYALGWGKSRIVDPVPTGSGAPDAPVPTADSAPADLAMPAFLAPHPVSGRAVAPVGDAKLVAAAPLTGAISRRQARRPSRSRKAAAALPAALPMTASSMSPRPMATISTTIIPRRSVP